MTHKLPIFKVYEKIQCRYVLVLMVYMCSCYCDMVRVNLSINIVAMAPVVNNGTLPDDNTLSWTPQQKAYVLAAYFWGCLAGNTLCGFLGERLGARLMMLLSLICCGILTMLSPLAAKRSYITLIVVRIGVGFWGGAIFPGTHLLIASWGLPKEKGMFVGALIGGTMGTFFAWTLCGFLIDAYGWEWGFYAFGLLAPFFALLWWFLTYDSPDQHPRISPKEKKLLQNGIKTSGSVKPPLPAIRILTTVPILSLFILNFGVGWGLYFVITAAPNYLANVLKYDMTSTGFLSGITCLTRSSIAIIVGSLGDVCLKKNLLNMKILRRVGIIFSHIMPGCALLVMTYAGFPKIVYVSLIALSMGFNGFVTVTSAANIHDLTSNFGGILGGWVTGIVTAGGIITPLVTAQLTKADETSVDLWRNVLYIAGAVFIFTGLQFMVFGSTKKQAWDEIKLNETEVK